MNNIICEGRVPADWSDSIIVSLFKGKGDALDQNNYCGLKLTDHLLKIIESVIENIVNIDEMQFGYCHSQGTTDTMLFSASFERSILRKILILKILYMAFVDLEKTFDRVP